MIKKYNQFINESSDIDGIPYYYSDQFREILIRLKSFDDDSVHSIANNLINLENTNTSIDNIGFIDITDKNDFVSFIQLNRLIRMYKDIKKTQTINKEEFYMWCFDKQDKKSDPVWKDQRSDIKIGKLATKILTKKGISFTTSDIEKFVNAYKSTFDSKDDISQYFELVKGEDIRKWYLEDNYESLRSGSLANSCMRYKKCQDFLNIYVMNPSVCSLLILKGKSQDKIVGRALIWETSKGTYMDRIYYNYDSDLNLFKEYADGKNWSTSLETSNISVILEKGEFDYYPYMDTFVYLYEKDNKWILSDREHDGSKVLQETDGNYSDDENRVWSEYHGEYLDSESAAYCEDIHDYVYIDDAKWCDYLGQWYSPNGDVTWSDFHSDNIHIDDSVYSEYLQDTIFSYRSIEITDGISEDYIPDSMKDRCVKIDDNYVLKINTIYDPIDDIYYFKKKPIILYEVTPENIEYVSEDDIIEYNNKKYITSDLIDDTHFDKFIKLSSSDYILIKHNNVNIDDITMDDFVKYLLDVDFKCKDLKYNSLFKHKITIDYLIKYLFVKTKDFNRIISSSDPSDARINVSYIQNSISNIKNLDGPYLDKFLGSDDIKYLFLKTKTYYYNDLFKELLKKHEVYASDILKDPKMYLYWLNIRKESITTV